MHDHEVGTHRVKLTEDGAEARKGSRRVRRGRFSK
jgi:hypothetical protein